MPEVIDMEKLEFVVAGIGIEVDLCRQTWELAMPAVGMMDMMASEN